MKLFDWRFKKNNMQPGGDVIWLGVFFNFQRNEIGPEICVLTVARRVKLSFMVFLLSKNERNREYDFFRNIT